MKLRITKKVITEDPSTQVDNNLRREWNKYVNHLQAKGLRGNPVLDKDGAWNVALEQYRKENPTTILTKEKIPIIQKEFQNYRQYVLDKIKQGKGQFAVGTNENNFMQDLSKVDGVAGSLTTKHSFPDEFLNTFEKGKLISTENKGFASK